MISKREFEEIAAIINEEMHTAQNRLVIAALARRLAESFKRRNPNFRYDKFYTACGLNTWGEVPTSHDTVAEKIKP